MKQTHRIKIITTHRRILRVRSAWAPCLICCREVEPLSLAQAADILEISPDALGDLMAAGGIHTLPTVSGVNQICRDSLFCSVANDNDQ